MPMGIEVVGWWSMAVVAVACAVGMLFTRNPVHAALWLVGNLIALAVIYLILSAPLLFALQLIVYAGAIMVLFLFVVMFFMSPKAQRWLRPPLKSQPAIGGIILIVFFLLLLWGLSNGGVFLTLGDVREDGVMTEQFVPEVSQEMGTPATVGMWLFNYHVLPFELIGVLLLIALLGAVMVARDKQAEGMVEVRGETPGQRGAAEAEE